MAGTIGLSLSQRYDKTSHEPLDGGLLYFYAAGTTTPQNAYQDIDLTIPWPNPMTLDSGGNVPQLFFDDGYIKIRLTNAAGVTQIEADYQLVVGPSSGGGGAPSVDATTILATGDIKLRHGTGVLSGFVRCNGRTIGSASSGATERANADCQALFEYLWNTDANLSVSGGRGASANADWVANKNIALPDWRGRAPAGLDDMGNSASGRLTTAVFGQIVTILGAVGGAETVTLAASQIPAGVPSSGSNSISVTSSSTVPKDGTIDTVVQGVGTPVLFARMTSGTQGTLTSTNGSQAIAVTSTNAGQTAVNKTQPTILMTIYIKL